MSRRKRPELGEWQTDETGRRFRKLGESCIEYEPTITVDGLEIPQSELTAYHERKKAAEQARKEAEKNRPAPPPQRNCPFKDGMQTACTGEQCAFYFTGCTLAQIGAPARDTAGRVCPFDRYGHKCREDCALYNGGTCSIMRLIECTRKDQK